jgi:hypothetical protein
MRADFAIDLVPWTADLALQEPAERRQVLIEVLGVTPFLVSNLGPVRTA